MYLPAIGFLQRGKILDVIDGCVPEEGKILLFGGNTIRFFVGKKESKFFFLDVGSERPMVFLGLSCAE